MTRVAVFAGGRMADYQTDFDYFVGVDRGAFFLLEKGLPLYMAVGDFDSVTAEERERIAQASEIFAQAQPEKDDTDLELALNMLFQKMPEAQVHIFGAFGGRLDHTLSNVFLPSDPRLAPYMRQFCLVDEQNLLCYFPEGKHQVEPKEGMTYVGFMSETSTPLTISGAKYPLNEQNFFEKKIYGSNEFIGQPIEVTCPKGYLVVIYSKDRS
ncbi:thiamine diphosphokinase [Streptococcus himalayensis]|uniref:Thiamine diphosphokinase n=1 Tax=Streptococcus himalayensis TaxID=1888195 RepID=A0A917A5S4_9STRE|nr:thiamine diphosphokinase [Streptococcus himalayensis]GGE24944.1 thiamine pyrophosphokinase [Streptococcus himalayensis]